MIESSAKTLVAITSILIILTSYIVMIPILLGAVYVNGVVQRKVSQLLVEWNEEFAQSMQVYNVIYNLVQNNKLAKDYRLSNSSNIITSLDKQNLNGIEDSFWNINYKWRVLAGLNIFSFRMSNIIVYILIAIMYFQGSITEGEVTVLYIASNTFVNNISGIFSNYSSLAGLEPAIVDMNEVLSYDGNEKERKHKVVADNIAFKNVSFKYGDKSIFEDVSFELDMSRDVVIIGENGAGKTTLLKLLTGLYSPSSGEILINGDVIEDESIEYSPIMQNELVPIMSIKEILKCDDNLLIEDALDAVNLNINKCDYDKVLSDRFYEDGIELSGGERQKLLLARAILSNKKLWVLDEPTSNIDPVSKNDIFKVINNSNASKILITHDTGVIGGNEQLLVIKEGIIKYYENAREVFE